MKVWHLDVNSLPLGVVVHSKGWVVRLLKWYMSWVYNVMKQFGQYPMKVLEHWKDFSLVQEDWEGCTFGVPVIVPTVDIG